jgi:sensor c-di-GMP phosphodiesterase-like protein
MDWPPGDYDEHVRRWRRKFFAWIAIGVVVGVALTMYLLHDLR